VKRAAFHRLRAELFSSWKSRQVTLRPIRIVGIPKEDMVSDSDGLVARESGEWAREKLFYLNQYLGIFSEGMKNKWAGKRYYVDLFAGPGVCRLRNRGEEFDGSPLIALGFDFQEYFFFEADSESLHALNERVKMRSPDKMSRVKIVPGDCNRTILSSGIPTDGLGVAFIDPTGISPLTFETIKALTAGRRIDLLINFPEGMGIRMNLHQYTQSDATALDRFIGSSAWKNGYERPVATFDQICAEIATEYLANLRLLGYQAVDRDWIPVKTNRNSLLYYLLFASKDPRGIDFWRKIKLIGPHGQRELRFT
jgi:three-Cys-motif partner protein